MSQLTGVVAIQGDFAKHLEALAACGAAGFEVRTPEDLRRASRVILPGGESSTAGLLMERHGLGEALREAAAAGMPVWGTCMGMILMATEIEGREQYCLGLLDVTVRRNAFGAQIHSFQREVPFAGLPEPVPGVFIRAPVVTRWGAGVEPLAYVDGQVVAVRQARLLGTAFHPELTPDLRVLRWFLAI
jgi:5'-phosphate synthase pdxT subunit